MKKLKLKLKLLTVATAFDNEAGWKMDEAGNITLKDGNPVYVDSNGGELALGQDTISRLNGEAKKLREARQTVEALYKPFEGLDAATARDAIEKMEKISGKELIDAGKVDDLKSQITTQFQEQLKEKDSSITQLQNKLNDTYVNDIFKSSDFVRNNIAVPQDMFEASFKHHFKVENGEVMAFGKNGDRLLSKTQAGEYASPEEALQIFVNEHPQKDVILKANVGSGSGGSKAGGLQGTGRAISRSDFDALSPVQRSQVITKVRAGEMSLTD